MDNWHCKKPNNTGGRLLSAEDKPGTTSRRKTLQLCTEIRRVTKATDEATGHREGTRGWEQDSTCFEVDFIFEVPRNHRRALVLTRPWFRIWWVTSGRWHRMSVEQYLQQPLHRAAEIERGHEKAERTEVRTDLLYGLVRESGSTWQLRKETKNMDRDQRTIP